MFRHINPLMQAKHGLELAEFFLLRHIAETELGPSEIAELMQMPAHAISRKLDSLEKGGFIERALDPKDSRKRILTPTLAGQAILEIAQKSLNYEIEAMLKKLPEDALEPFLMQLEQLS